MKPNRRQFLGASVASASALSFLPRAHAQEAGVMPLDDSVRMQLPDALPDRPGDLRARAAGPRRGRPGPPGSCYCAQPNPLGPTGETAPARPS